MVKKDKYMETLKKYKRGENPKSYAIGKRKYSVDDNFFAVPNELNSYYAGFIAADGCIIEKQLKNCTTKYLNIAIHSKDVELLEQFKKDINYNGPISYYKNNEFVRISINSTKIVDDLRTNFNITPRKTFTLEPPNLIETSQIASFIIGYIDGDGSISFSNDYARGRQKNMVIGIVGTYSMLSWILQFCQNITNSTHKTKPCVSKGGFENKNGKKQYTVNISNKWCRNVFLKFWDINVPKLKRKWTEEFYDFCLNFKKRLPVSRRKGVNIFNLNGDLVTHCETLKEAQEYTGVDFARISMLCKINDNHHMSNGFMFSRDKEVMEPYHNNNGFAKTYSLNF